MIPPDKRVFELTWLEVKTELLEMMAQGQLHPLLNAPKQLHSEYMDIAECAKLTGYTIGYLRQLIHKRKLPFHKRPNFKPVRFLRSEILEFMGGKKYTPIDEMADDYLSNSKTKKR